MSKGTRPIWVAGACSALLVLTMSTGAFAATIYVDANGNGIEDHCETGVVPDAIAAAASLAAADTDHNGTVSEAEATQAGWIGSENCTGGTTDPGQAPAPTPVPTPTPTPKDPPTTSPGAGRGHHSHPQRHHHRHHHGGGHH